MKILKEILRHRGMSLVGVIISMAVISAIGVVLMQNSQTISSSNSATTSRSDFKTISSTFHNKFLDMNYCAASLGGRVVPKNFSLEEVPTSLNELNRQTYDNTGTMLLGSRNSISIPMPTLELRIPAATAPPLQFGRVNLVGMNLIRPASDASGLFLEFQFQRNNLKSFGGQDLTKRIPIIVTFDVSGTVILSCYSDKNDQISNNLPTVINELKAMKIPVFTDANGYLRSSGGSAAGALFTN